jgi:hypothetical protein
MVHVHSSWFPLVDRNPQTFVDIYRAPASAFRTSTQRVYRSAPQLSSIGVKVLTPGDAAGPVRQVTDGGV